MKLAKTAVYTAALLFVFASASFADSERACRNQCVRSFDERGALTACFYGCDMQFSNMSLASCEAHCAQRFDRNDRGDEASANEQVSACMSGCNM